MIVRVGLHDYSPVKLTQAQRLQLARGRRFCWRLIVGMQLREKLRDGFGLRFAQPNGLGGRVRMRLVRVAQVLRPSFEAARLRALDIGGDADDAAPIGAVTRFATAPKNAAYVRGHEGLDAAR